MPPASRLIDGGEEGGKSKTEISERWAEDFRKSLSVKAVETDLFCDLCSSSLEMSSKKKLTYKEKSSITFVESAEPRFIQKLKEQLGYKPPPTIEDKFASTSAEGYVENDTEEDDLNAVRKEDAPQIVVVNEGDLSEEQVNAEMEKQREEEDRKKIAEGKITFKKPLKRAGKEAEEAKKEKKPRKSEAKSEIMNSRLLSFGDDEEDEA